MGLIHFVDYSTLRSLNTIITCFFLFVGLYDFIRYYNKKGVVKIGRSQAFFLLFLSILVIGLYPIVDGDYNDRLNYWNNANDIANGDTNFMGSDLGFTYLTKLFTLLPVDFYFLCTACCYVGGIYMFCKSLSPRNFVILFVGMLLNFQFIAYGVNTVRAGMASGFVLMAIALREKKIFSYALMALAISVHKSFALPVLCYLISTKFDKTGLYYALWLLAIPLSALAGDWFQNHFAILLASEERASYLTTAAADSQYKVGFRLDYILYSCIPVFAGYYYIYKRKYQDRLYKTLYNTYVLANIFWILIIRSDFSDRFAYLSWFIYSPIILYPLVKQPGLVRRQNTWIACTILGLAIFNIYA